MSKDIFTQLRSNPDLKYAVFSESCDWLFSIQLFEYESHAQLECQSLYKQGINCFYTDRILMPFVAFK